MFISLYMAMELNLRLPMILVVNLSAPSPMIFSLFPSLWQNLCWRQRSKEAVQNCRPTLHMWQHVWIASRCENYSFAQFLVSHGSDGYICKRARILLWIKKQRPRLWCSEFQFLILQFFQFLFISLQKGHFLSFSNALYELVLSIYIMRSLGQVFEHGLVHDLLDCLDWSTLYKNRVQWLYRNKRV